MTSTSRSSVSSIIVRFLSNADSKEVMRDLRDKVDLAKSKLPKDANDPAVSEISFDDTPVWIFSISGEYDNFELYSFAKDIKDEIEANPLVSEVNISG
ncbi:MAG: efflux RND transporter permease subunit [Candidatus Peribacteria bacterium]|nr:efflux RND transporter permease subunit [Candidatus Peribacteria bacterium]